MSGSLTITTPNDRDVVIKRVFDAPRHLVFAALTEPDLMRRWYGQQGWTMDVCEIDLRVGGAFRFVSRQPNGKTVGQFGKYREVVRDERLVYSERWEDWDPGETIVTMVLTEQRGKTTFTETIHFPSTEVRDIVLKSGIESGGDAMYQRLEAVLAAATSSPR